MYIAQEEGGEVVSLNGALGQIDVREEMFWLRDPTEYRRFNDLIAAKVDYPRSARN